MITRSVPIRDTKGVFAILTTDLPVEAPTPGNASRAAVTALPHATATQLKDVAGLLESSELRIDWLAPERAARRSV